MRPRGWLPFALRAATRSALGASEAIAEIASQRRTVRPWECVPRTGRRGRGRRQVGRGGGGPPWGDLDARVKRSRGRLSGRGAAAGEIRAFTAFPRIFQAPAAIAARAPCARLVTPCARFALHPNYCSTRPFRPSRGNWQKTRTDSRHLDDRTPLNQAVPAQLCSGISSFRSCRIIARCRPEADERACVHPRGRRRSRVAAAPRSPTGSPA
jgi:hypothetical protein